MSASFKPLPEPQHPIQYEFEVRGAKKMLPKMDYHRDLYIYL